MGWYKDILKNGITVECFCCKVFLLVVFVDWICFLAWTDEVNLTIRICFSAFIILVMFFALLRLDCLSERKSNG